MSNFENLSDVMTGHNPHQELLKQTRKLVGKWEPTGLLDGIDDSTKKTGMAVLLENQATQLIKEASQTGTGGSKEEWSGVALPLVRRIFGEISAQEFVSVQPMNLPSGLVFFLDFKYGSAGQANISQNTDIFGNTSGSDIHTPASQSAAGGLYGGGKFGYSINDKEATAISVGVNGVVTASATWKEVEFEPSLSQSVHLGQVIKVSVPGNLLTRPDYNGVKAWELSGSNLQSIYPQYTLVDDINNPATASFFATGTSFVAAHDMGVKYHQAPVATNRGDFEQQTFTTPGPATGDDLQIPEVDIQLRSEAIVAKTRKLKAVWTPELAQDLNAYHSVDAEAELTAMLSEYIAMEIDLEILDMLKLNASAKTEYWSAKVGFEYDGSGTGEGAWSEISGASNAYTKPSWFQTLGIKIQAVSNAIHQKTLRGGANFVVVSPETSTILESVSGYIANTGDASGKTYAMGVEAVGSINNRYTVYKNPYMLDNTILVGFRGSNFLETGAVYAPYVPMIMTPLVYDPQNFTPRKGVMTRYAKKMVRPEFYGKVICAHTDNI
ncbi:MAG: hypothetical protein CBD58_00430 [bacterium TMED198]|nr:MAG: hypothetical protein CBD58_00430 [bacterium TMED198]